MTLVAGGDSFIFGAELADQLNGQPSISTYPALLAKQAGMEYFCAAQSGNANSAISRMTMMACHKLQNPIALVTWTFAGRYEFRFNYDTRQIGTPWQSINPWTIVDNMDEIDDQFHTENEIILLAQKKHIETARSTGVSEFAKTFFKHVGDSEYYELYSSLKEILFLQNYFVTNNIPYLFVTADNHLYDHPNYYRQRDECIDAIYSEIDWNNWFFFPSGTSSHDTLEPRGFYQWAVENKYSMGTTHPLEDAHAAAAILLKEKFNELVN